MGLHKKIGIQAESRQAVHLVEALEPKIGQAICQDEVPGTTCHEGKRQAPNATIDVPEVFQDVPGQVPIICAKLQVEANSPVNCALAKLRFGEPFEHLAAQEDIAVAGQDETSPGAPNADVLGRKLHVFQSRVERECRLICGIHDEPGADVRIEFRQFAQHDLRQ